MANALMLNTLALLDALAARGGACGMEHPADPGFDPLPSIWATDVMLGLQERRSFVSRTSTSALVVDHAASRRR